jgi:hypothetical protein
MSSTLGSGVLDCAPATCGVGTEVAVASGVRVGMGVRCERAVSLMSMTTVS